MENNLRIKKFERSLNKFMNLWRKDVPRSYVETKTIKRIEEACSSSGCKTNKKCCYVVLDESRGACAGRGHA
jgi:hypothetical protein